jgi:hypothetical protein
MALEIAVGISHLTRRQLRLYGLPAIGTGGGPDVQHRITDLYEVPLPWAEAPAAPEDPDCETLRVPPLPFTVLLAPGARAAGPDFEAFANGRTHVVDLARLGEDDSPPSVRVEGHLLSLYSYAFYPLDDALTALLRRVVPKPRYQELADVLVDQLGDFDALHLRLGDFLVWPAMPRAGSVPAEEILANLDTRIAAGRRLLILTTTPDHGLVAEIQRRYRQSVIFETWAEGAARSWTRRFPSLSPVEWALVGQLVAVRSAVFVGSMGSTYTAMIHRDRGLGRHAKRDFLFAYNGFPEAFDLDCCAMVEQPSRARFSWRRLRRKAEIGFWYFAYFREWPEVFTVESPAPPPAGP